MDQQMLAIQVSATTDAADSKPHPWIPVAAFQQRRKTPRPRPIRRWTEDTLPGLSPKDAG